MRRIDDHIFQAFQRYQDIALQIAGECDALLEDQREVAYFAEQLRIFLAYLRELLSLSVITETRCTIDTTAARFSKITAELAKIETAVGIDSTYTESVPVFNVASFLTRKKM